MFSIEIARKEKIMQHIIEEFNSFFEGNAKIELIENNIEITIGSRTLTIQLPCVIGVKSKDQSQKS
jgi:hypothetical protein